MAQNTLISSTPTPIPKTAEEDPVKKCFDKCGGYVEPCFSQCIYAGAGAGEGQPCTITAGCQMGLACVNGICTKSESGKGSQIPTLKSPCPKGEGYKRPINGQCKAGESSVKSAESGLWWCCPGTLTSKCQDDADCVTKHGAGWTCGADGKCVAPPSGSTSCTRNSDCAIGYECISGACEKKGGGGGGGGGAGGGTSGWGGEQFGWSPEIQALLARILDRANSLLDQPLGLTDEERQAIYNRIFEKIKGMEGPTIQSAYNRISRQGLLGSPYAEREVAGIQRGTRELLTGAERDIEIQEAQDRYQQLLGTTGMAQNLLGTGMGAEQLVEAANAARRGEGTMSLNSILQYLIATGGQNSTYYQALLNWLTQHGG